MQTLDVKIYKDVEKIAYDRGIPVQMLLRVIIVPEWLSNYKSRQYGKRGQKLSGIEAHKRTMQYKREKLVKEL